MTDNRNDGPSEAQRLAPGDTDTDPTVPAANIPADVETGTVRAPADELKDADDRSDSIEPSRIPGSAEDIDVAGTTGPGPSG